MRYLTSSFKRKLLVGGILLACFYILLSAGPLFAANTLIEEITITSEGTGALYMTFRVKQTFSITWYQHSGDNCYWESYNGTIRLYNADDLDPQWTSPIIGEDKLGWFKENESCDLVETFTAGITYKAYITEVYLRKDYTAAQNKATQIYQKDEQEFWGLDEETEFTLKWKEGGDWYDDCCYLFTLAPEFTITSPADESELTSSFDIKGNFANAAPYERVMIVFEDWHASSTCPIYGTSEWETERALGYFHYQSIPYFSPIFATSTGTTSIAVSDLAARNYKCTRCFLIKESTGAISYELCPDYNIEVLLYIPPSDLPYYYLPIASWADYYAEHSERFTTSTPLFINWAGTFEPLIAWIGNTVLSFQQYFDPDVAQARGEEMGNAVATARGYLEIIDDFFGGLPLSTVFIFYLITALVVIVYRLVKGILTIIVP